jgi:hypothetical protein
MAMLLSRYGRSKFNVFCCVVFVFCVSVYVCTCSCMCVKMMAATNAEETHGHVIESLWEE